MLKDMKLYCKIKGEYMKAIIFDSDGTLVDSMWLWEDLASRYLISIGIQPTDGIDEEVKELNYLQASLYIKEKFHIDKKVEEIIDEIGGLLVSYYKDKIQLKPNVLETLNILKGKGVRMCIGTANEEHLVSLILDRYEISYYFEMVKTSSQLGLSKADPQFFQKIVDLLDMESKDIWVFEDTLHCILAAKEIGLSVVAISDDSAILDREEIKEVADIYIEDFSQLNIERLL